MKDAKFDEAVQHGGWNAPEPNSLILEVEKERLNSFLGGETFEFRLA